MYEPRPLAWWRGVAARLSVGLETARLLGGGRVRESSGVSASERTASAVGMIFIGLVPEGAFCEYSLCLLRAMVLSFQLGDRKDGRLRSPLRDDLEASVPLCPMPRDEWVPTRGDLIAPTSS